MIILIVLTLLSLEMCQCTTSTCYARGRWQLKYGLKNLIVFALPLSFAENYNYRTTHYLCCACTSSAVDDDEIEIDVIQDVCLGRKPVEITCPCCLMPSTSLITWVITPYTRRVARRLAVLGLWWLPFVVQRWKMAKHTCQYCHAYLGSTTYKTCPDDDS